MKAKTSVEEEILKGIISEENFDKPYDEVVVKIYSKYKIARTCYSNENPKLQKECALVLAAYHNTKKPSKNKYTPDIAAKILNKIFEEEQAEQKKKEEKRFKAAFKYAVKSKPNNKIVLIDNDFINESRDPYLLEWAKKRGKILKIENFRNRLYLQMPKVLSNIVGAKIIATKTVLQSDSQLEEMMKIFQAMMQAGIKKTFYIQVLCNSLVNRINDYIDYETNYKHDKKKYKELVKQFNEIFQFHIIYEVAHFFYDDFCDSKEDENDYIKRIVDVTDKSLMKPNIFKNNIV